MLKRQYEQAAKDIANKISLHNGRINALLKDWDDLDDAQKSILQSQIYQRDYQQALQQQIDGFLDNLNSKQHETVSGYLEECYETGYLGTMYDLHGQGIPLIMPIDQKQALMAVTLNSKVSKKLYGSYTNQLKKRIQQEISRGIATASSYADIARNLDKVSNIGYNKAARIARTEGHGIQCQAASDAQHAAKDSGADIVKQWDAALDGRTRDSHRMVDGQVRELDEKFSNGMMRPGDSSGGASEVVNCRCALLQRARWALGEEELKTLQERAEYFGLNKTDDFADFKRKYLNIPAKYDKIYKKIDVEEIPAMNKDLFRRVKRALEIKGVKVIQDADGDAYLKAMGAEAMTLSDGSAIIFQSGRVPSASAFFEEIIHTTQIRKSGMITSVGEEKGYLEYLNREIEANEKLLKYADAYRLTEKDIESVKENLKYYYRLKEGKKNV